MTRNLLAGMLFATLSLPTSLYAQQSQPPSLADIAKKAQEERAKKAEEERAKSAKTDKSDKTDKTDKADSKGTDKADSKSKKVYTDADLSPTTSTTSPAPATSVTQAPEPAHGVPTETTEMKAKRVLAFELDRLAFKIRDWSRSVDSIAKMCDKGSYIGLTGGSLQGHRQFCQEQLTETEGKRTNINQLANELESKAAREGIAPGVARDLVKAMGWEGAVARP